MFIGLLLKVKKKGSRGRDQLRERGKNCSLFREQVAHGVFAGDARKRFADDRGAGDLADLRAGFGGGRQRNRVRNDQLVESGIHDAFNGGAGEHRVRDVGDDALGAALLQGTGGVAERAGRVNDVVGDDAGAALDFTDDVHDFSDVGARTALVDDGEVDFESLGHGAGADNAADVRGNNHQVVVLAFDEVVEKNRGGVNVVDRDVEEALDLVGMEVHREDAVNADGLKHVGDDLGGDGHARGTRTAVLTGIAVVGDRSRDAAGGRTLEGVNHDHEFHQVVVRRSAGALKDEDVLAAHIVEQLNHDFAVAEAVDGGGAKGNVEIFRDSLGKFRVGVAREDHHTFRNHGIHDLSSFRGRGLALSQLTTGKPSE